MFEEDLRRRSTATLHCSVHKFSVPAYIYIVLMAMCLILPTPTLYILRQLIQFHIPDTTYTLPVSFGHGYPWIVPKGYLYHIHLLFELAQFPIVYIATVPLECSFGFYAYLLSSNLTALSFRLTNPQLKEQFSDLINMCLKKHHILLESRENLEHVYGPSAFLHIITNAAQICAFAYLLTVSKYKCI